MPEDTSRDKNWKLTLVGGLEGWLVFEGQLKSTSVRVGDLDDRLIRCF